MIVFSGKILSQVAFDMGYESTSQFSGEYTRMYGQSPNRDKRAASARWGTVNAAE